MRIPVKRINEYPRTIYLYSKGDYENMNEELDKISLNNYDSNRDMDTNWRRFRDVYQILIEKYVPRKMIKVGHRFKAPWMKDSQATRSKTKNRKIWLKYKASGLTTDKYQYRDYVNEHKKNMYEAKGRYEERLINSLKDNHKRFYNYTRMCTKSSSTIDFIEDKTTHKIKDPQQICDLLNDFFTSVMTKTNPIDSEIHIPGRLLKRCSVTSRLQKKT